MELLDNLPFYEGSVFTDVIAPNASLHEVHFDGCSFTGCDFSGTTFESCTFADCHFVNCNLSLLKIPNTQIENSSFTDCKMIGINWAEAHWRKSPNKKKQTFTITFCRCVLNYSIFIGLNLMGAKFKECSLREIGFEGADLECADFSGSDLSEALFADTNLTKADLSSAKNYTVNVQRNRVTKAKFAMPEAMSLIYALDIVIEQ